MRPAIQTVKRFFNALFRDGKGLTAGFVIVAALLVATIWFVTLSRIAHERALAIESSLADSSNIASIGAANLDEVLGRALLYATIGQSLLSGDQAGANWLNPLMLRDPAYLRVAVFDAAGGLIHSSARRSSEPELAPLVSAALALPPSAQGGTQMTIGRPATQGGSAWRVPLLVPIHSRGAKAGYFAAIIDLGYFLKLYKEVNLGAGGRIEILYRDGFQLAEINGTTLAAGADFGGTAYTDFLREPRSSGEIAAARPGESLRGIGVFRKLEHYPLTVVVSRDLADLQRQLAPQHNTYFWRASMVSTVVVLLALGLAALAGRQRHLYNVLADSEHEKHRLIEQLEEEKSRALQQASHDYLTGIPNRMLFYELAAAELARAKRSRNLYALLFLDLDKFKLINDTLGHTVGDRLLQEVAGRLRHSLREYDLVARFGGDEFVILVSEIASEEQVAKIGADIVELIRQPYPDLSGHEVEVSPSVGIALYPRDGQNVETLLAHADAAMYLAKSAGAGTHRFYDASLNASSARRFELLGRFRRAIKDNEFCMHYQPRVELQDFGLVALEALVRWQHPEHGLIYPNEFIALAEENDLIVPLGHWIIDAVCAQIAQWQLQGIQVRPVAINVSAKQLRDEALLETVMDALARHRVAPELLEIEVTESCIIEEPAQAQRVLESLREHGIRAALDDYGTGFSGLSHLKTLPIHAIKIDRSFIRDIRNDTSDAMIVASTISLAHNLGLLVVAEGVESTEQLVHLKTAGCDQVQGFYFQRPVSAADIVPSLQRGKFSPL